MNLHPDLAKLMPENTWGKFDIRHRVVCMDADDLTAFALAVARAERERCRMFVRDREDDDFDTWAAHTIADMPDPDWATP